MPSIDDLPPPPSASPVRAKSSIDDLPSPNADRSGVINKVRGYLGKAPIDWNAEKDKMEAIQSGREAMPEPIAGTPPMVAPVGALGAFGKAAVALSEGQGLGYAAGRTALSAGQGAVMSAMDGKPGESLDDKFERAKSGAKLSGGIQLAAESLPYIGKALGYGLRKGGELLSGVDESVLQNYAKRTDEVNKLIKESGGDMTEAADNARKELSSGIQKTKGQLSKQVAKGIESAPVEKIHELDPILEPLEKQRVALLAKRQVEEASQLESIIDKVKQFGHDKDPVYGVSQYTGKVNAQELNSIKGLLQDIAAPAYQQNGQIFNYAKSSQQAAKYSGAVARKVLNEAVPEVAQANNQLSAMHTIEGNLNRNLLAEGKSDSALFAAGSGANPRNQKMLQKLGELGGVDALQKAKDLATARDFANPSFMAKGTTGKVAARMMAGAGLGYMFDGEHGAMVGGALASPMALKGVINAANVVGKVGVAAKIPQFAQAIRQNPLAAQTLAQLTASQIRHANSDNPMTGGTNEMPGDQAPPALLQNKAPEPKGEDRWARSGAQKLGINDPAIAQQLLQSKEGKRLLIEASDLAPGSARMNRIKEQINSLSKGLKDDSLSGTAPKVLRLERQPSSGR